MLRIFIIKEKQIEYVQNQETGEQQEFVTEIGEPIILNVDNDDDAEQLLASGAWEMPQKDVKRVFGEYAYLACNINCKITEDKEQGYTVVFTLPKEAEEDLTKAKDIKKKQAEQALSIAIETITPYYPTDEKVSFAKQEQEAIKYLANPKIDEKEIPCIASIAKGRKMPLAELTQKIITKAGMFSTLSGLYMGRKQRIEDLVDKAQTVEEVQAIDVEKIFSEPLIE